MAPQQRVHLSAILVLVLCLLHGAALAGEPLRLVELEIDGPESLDSELPIVGTSHHSDGTVHPGIITNDDDRDTTASVEFDVVTDATGTISGIAVITIFRRGVAINVVDVPVTGRQKSDLQAIVEFELVETRRGEDVAPFRERLRSALAIRGLTHEGGSLLHGVLLRARQDLLHDTDGIVAGSPEYNGQITVFARDYHRAKARVVLAAIFYEFAEVFALGNTITGDVLSRRLVSEAVVFSDSLDVLIGGENVLRYAFADYARQRPGQYALRGQLDLFRWAAVGYLFLSEAQARGESVTAEELLDRSLQRGMLLSTPAMRVLILARYNPELIREILQNTQE